MQSAGYVISYNGTHAAVTAFLNCACFTGKVNLFSHTVLQPRDTHRNSSSMLEVNAKRNQKSGSFAQGERKGINFQKKKCALLIFCLKEAHRQGAVGNMGCCACAITSSCFLAPIVAPISIKYYSGTVGVANTNIRCSFRANFTSSTLQNYLGLKHKSAGPELGGWSYRHYLQELLGNTRKNSDISTFNIKCGLVIWLQFRNAASVSHIHAKNSSETPQQLI